jgi:hypothetical protein
VPYAPRPPFRLYAGEKQAPVTVPDAATIIASARRGEAEFTYLVPGEARPVLLLSDPPAEHHQEVTALRLLRLSKLDAASQEHVREQRDPLLFHLDPTRFDLPEENAAMVSALVRIHIDAIETESRGELNPNELRVLGERLIEFYRFDTRLLIERRIRQLAARRQEREEG